MANKTWKKSIVLEANVGKCRYCEKDMINSESFVAFFGGDKAHYECMKKDDYKKLIEKAKHEKGLSQN